MILILAFLLRTYSKAGNMKYILDANNPGRKYTFNLYTTHKYEDGAVSEDVF